MSKLNFSIKSKSDNKTKTIVRARSFTMIIDEPATLGGTDEGANPVEFLLAALAGCLTVVGHLVAGEMKFKINDLQFSIEGDLDPAKFLGTSDKQRAGYQEVRVSIDIKSEASEEILAKWLKEVERRCPVSDNITNQTKLNFNIV